MKIVLIILAFLTTLHADKDIKVQLRWKHQFQFAGYYMALHKGFYRDAGLNVTLIEGDSATDVVKTVLSEEADFGISNSSLVLDYMSGKAVVMIGTVFQHSPNIILAKKEFKSPSDLVGAGKIALMGGEQDIELKAMFIKEGVDLAKVAFVPKERHLEDLLEDKVVAMNAYISNEPFLLTQNKIDFSIIDPRIYGLDFYGDTLFSSTKLYKKDYKTVSDFREASFKGWEYALQNIQESVEVIEKFYNTQAKSKEHLIYEAKAIKKLINPDFIQIGHSNPGRWEHIVTAYEQFGLVHKRKNLNDFFYSQTKEVDLTWFYFYFFISSITVLLVGGIAYYIHNINKKLLKSEQRHKILFQNSASAGLVWKKNYVITEWNEQATKLFGWSAEEVLGRSFFDFLVPEDEKIKVQNNLCMVSNDTNLYIFTNKNMTKNGNIIVCEWHNTLLQKSSHENDFEIVSLAIDITKRVQEEELLKIQANYDFLTTLPNRHFFQNILEKAHSLANRNKTVFGIAIIDLDGFKAVNDTYGHDAGDTLLKEISKKFQQSIRVEDTIARIGGDEFGLIFHTPDTQESYEKVLERLLEHAKTPVKYTQESELSVSASIGVSFYSKTNDVELKTLINQADEAMYEAKRGGKNRFSIYTF